MEHQNMCFSLSGRINSGFRSLFDTEVDIRLRAFTVVALAGAVGNSLGFLANLLLYGFNFVTGFCFLCAVLIICNLFFGLKSRYGISLGYLMLIVLDVLEFPLLTLTYGAVMYPYLIIGFHAVVMVAEKRRQIVLCVLLGIYDIAVIVYSHLNPYIFGPQDPVGLLGSAVVTFAISIFTVGALVTMWQSVYLVETTETDHVTGALSQLGFDRKAARILSADSSGEYVILYFNVVSFKAINSIFDIEGGNRFLLAVSDRLVHSPFTPRLVGRINADHFVCLTKKAQLDRSCLEDICRMPYRDKGRDIKVLLNCGIYEISDRSIPVSSMCDMACAAMRFLHNSGSRFYADYNELAASDYRSETEILAEIGNAIRREQFVPYYQPIVDCATGKIVSAEALARWIHPEIGMISPSVFIPVLEKKDLISNLDRIIVRRVHTLLKKCLAEGRPIVPVSVNLSRVDIYDREMMDELYESLRENAGDCRLYRFEITESAYEGLSSHTLDTVSSLRRAGAEILVDDFGSGFSSLGMITDYEFDIIKLDVQFSAKLADNEKMFGVVQSLVDMSHKLGARVVAEGVENEAQYQAVKKCGCDYVQGYYFYRPVSEEQFLALLASQE